MELEGRLRARLDELLKQGLHLSGTWDQIRFPDKHTKQHFFREQQAFAEGWLASARALVSAILPDPFAPHRESIERIASGGASGNFVHQVTSVRHVLGVIEIDLRHG